MGLPSEALHEGLDALAAREPAFARALARAGYPAPRSRPRGAATLLRTIVGQQVSVAAANSVWARLETLLGPECPAPALLTTDEEALRACGLSRQKQGYARSLAALVASGELDLTSLPEGDEAAIALLTRIKGIGRWSAEIYLLFAEGRADIWPAGDLAVQVGLARLFDMEARPSEAETRARAETWRPWRGAAAIFTWHVYNNSAL